MKKLLFNFLFWLSFLSVSTVFAQEDVMFFKRAKVYIIGDYDGAEIKLRLAPADIENWEYGLKHGYKIERMTLIEVGDSLSPEEILASKLILVDSLKPVNESQWDSVVGNSDNSQIAKAMLYGEEFQVLDINDVDFERAFNVNSEKENRYSFSLYVAEQSFELARKMGLGYVDTNIVQNSQYIYFALPSGLDGYGDSVFKSYVKISTSNNQVQLAPQNLTVIPGDSIMYLSWDQGVFDKKFTSFDIERSEDGVNFEKINDLPIVPASEVGDNDMVFYVDTIPSNGVEYYYRVTGNTTFGPCGAYSNVASGIGREAPYPMNTVVDSIIEHDEGKLTIYWTTPEIDSMPNDHVKAYNIYRAPESNGNYVLLNTTPLSPSQNSFVDENPLPSNYYIIESIDENDNIEKSIAYLGQPVDREPPAPPVILSGECNKSGVITLHWQANTEPDLERYRIYMANNKDEEFSIIGVTQNTDFVYDISIKTLSREVYFKIVAEDHRENFSDFSDIITVEIPDIVPPERPTIIEARPFQDKIKIKWLLSKSDDLKYHKLLRKKFNATSWDTIYILNAAGGKDFVFYDKTTLNGQKYIYKVLAFDKSGNVTESRHVEISRIDSGERGQITNFMLVKRKLNRDDLTHLTQYGSIGDFIASHVEGKDTVVSKNKYKNVVLGWDYNYPEDLIGFEVYRSTNNAPFSRYKFYTIKELFGVDSWEDISLDNGLMHCVAFDLYARVNNVLKYKVRAIHDYGGYSQFSKIKYINIWGQSFRQSDVDGGIGH